jgi:hypothetical protein
MGFESQFNGPFAITAVVLLFLGAIADIVRRRFWRRSSNPHNVTARRLAANIAKLPEPVRE